MTEQSKLEDDFEGALEGESPPPSPLPQEKAQKPPEPEKEPLKLLSTDRWLAVPNLRSYRLPKPYNNPLYGDRNEISGWEWVKIVLLGIILIPLRALLIVLLLGGVTLVLLVASIGSGLKFDFDGERIAPWRAKVFGPLCRFVARCVIFVLGVYYVPVKGTPASPKEVPIVVINHLSYIDPFLTMWLGFTHIGKKDAAIKPLLRVPCTYLEIVAVDRESDRSKSSAKNRIKEYVDRRNEPGFRPFAVYPEGTTGSGGCILRFKPGAFTPGLPVQPLLLTYKYTFLNPCENFYDRYWFVRLFVQLIGFVEARYLPPYYPNEEEKKDPALFALNVRAYMARESNLNISEYSVNDMLLMYTAEKSGAKKHAGSCSVEWGIFKANFGLAFGDAKMLMKHFCQGVGEEKGVLTRDSFKKIMPSSWQRIDKCFEFFDQDGDGLLTFRDFLWSACLLRKEAGISFEMVTGEDQARLPEKSINALIKENLDAA